ncbi:MAG TPA: polysaccharide biosynthesis C-terminal domain-containing protein, partial [Cyclobacteriaceae bacterium]
YYEGLVTVPILLSSYLFLGVYYNFSVWFKLVDKTYYGTFITIGGAILTITLNFALIPIGGYSGSSWASLVCYFSMAVACYFTGQRHYPIPYKIKAGFGYILLSILLVFVSNQLPATSQLAATTIHFLLMLTFFLIAYFNERKSPPPLQSRNS